MILSESTQYPDKPIRRIEEREVYSNRFVTVYDDDVVLSTGKSGRYLRIVESGGRPGVASLAECDGRFALVRTFRYTLDEWEWAIPRGYAHGDSPLESIRAELREELGGIARKLVPMGEVTPNTGMLTGRVQLFYACFDEQVTTPDDTEEVAEVRWIYLKELLSEIANGNIIDSFTLSSVTAAAARGLIKI